MTPVFSDHDVKQERTLRLSFLLSLWGPLATGLAVLLSQSSTQLADFLRRTVELAALSTSWLVFRHLMHHPHIDRRRKIRLERAASRTVATTMGLSGLFMVVYALFLWSSTSPGGNVYPGLTIAVLGFFVNTWFWRRYRHLHRENPGLIVESQRRLYRSKALVDLAVIAALSSVAFFPARPLTALVDRAGSLAVSVYLLWSCVSTLRTTLPKDDPTRS